MDEGEAAAFTAAVRVVDEEGAALVGASVELDDQTVITDECGQAAVVDRSDPVMLVIRSPGYLAEPVVLGFSDRGQVVEVTLLSDKGGARWVMHSGGDVMLSRRYQDNPYGEPLLPADDLAGGARRVVAPIARAFSAADLRTVNLETVVSDLPPTVSYPAKTVVINTNPETMAGLQELGVNLAVLGNNHVRDYFGDGVIQTMAALDSAGIPHVGASDGLEPASAPHIVDIHGLRVGTLSWSMLAGDGANDRYPKDGDAMPADVDPEDLWPYEARVWGFSGSVLTVPEAPRRIGSAWELFHDAEPTLDPTECAAAWASLVAVYPELQDWVERRGHGGAAWWQDSGATARIQALAEVADVVIVQIHGSNEFEHAPAPSLLANARAAVDAGADMVIVHHPHVLQGVEWYKGRLIVHSLGNFLFDQHFEITTPTAMLRTVWEGDELIEARMIPLDLGNYRPNPVADDMAIRHARSLWETSASGDISDRGGEDGSVLTFLAPPAPDSEPGHVRMRSHDMVFRATPPATEAVAVEVAAGATVAIDHSGLIHSHAGGADLLLGRELFGWGGLEDPLADSESHHDLHWRVAHSDARVVVADDAAGGRGYATLHRTASNQSNAWIGMFARVAVPEHRHYRDIDGTTVAADGDAMVSVRMQARADCQAAPFVRLDQYTRDEAKPSSKLGEVELPFEITGDGQWHQVNIDVPADALIVDARRVGALKVQIRLPPPGTGECNLDLDDLQLIEWRLATDLPDRFGAYDYVRNPGPADVSVTLTAMPLREP